MEATHSHWTTIEGLGGQQKSRYAKEKMEPTSISKIDVAYLCALKNDYKATLAFYYG